MIYFIINYVISKHSKKLIIDSSLAKYADFFIYFSKLSFAKGDIECFTQAYRVQNVHSIDYCMRKHVCSLMFLTNTQ